MAGIGARSRSSKPLTRLFMIRFLFECMLISFLWLEIRCNRYRKSMVPILSCVSPAVDAPHLAAFGRLFASFNRVFDDFVRSVVPLFRSFAQPLVPRTCWLLRSVHCSIRSFDRLIVPRILSLLRPFSWFDFWLSPFLETFRSFHLDEVCSTTPFVPSVVHCVARPFNRSIARSFLMARSFVRSFVQPFNRSFVCSVVESFRSTVLSLNLA